MSIWHMLILLVILLVIFGPQRLEGIGVSLGRAVKGFKKGLDEADAVVASVKSEPAKEAAKPAVETPPVNPS
jgi:sec-independent protein translocase protein TatA